ncbi:IS30 family transposase [Nocardiopsis alba]|jgi:IS30 family transposase|uniref:IS30 family transposase n=7 Tax=Nocardiopsis alba TaxID=53437 RepID=UPI00034B4CD1|nr:IS30 family transposase [Nocardiopsis alba]
MNDFQIRDRSVNQGRTKLVREREEYFRLMEQGYSSREACRIVGINRRTGKVWRNGRHPHKSLAKAVPPIRRPRSSPGSSRFLNEEDRVRIADMLQAKSSIRSIAAELGRAPSTIGREVRRNRSYYATAKKYRYGPHAAQTRAEKRRRRPKPRKLDANPRLREYVQQRLQQRWSPEQIVHLLRRDFPDDQEMRVSHETIYQALYIQGRGQLRRDLAKLLRTGRTMRRPQRQSTRRQKRFTAPMVMISERPPEAADRAVPGHWEGDLIIGKAHKSAIGTLVERSTRFVTLVHLPRGYHPEQFRDALVQVVSDLPAQLRRSLTWDQGSEMARHAEFTTATDIPVYFCDPASPWQRGSNENTNGLLRQYFPKGTDLAAHSREDLDAVAAELNSRPRKTLGWETPAERLAKLLSASN